MARSRRGVVFQQDVSSYLDMRQNMRLGSPCPTVTRVCSARSACERCCKTGSSAHRIGAISAGERHWRLSRVCTDVDCGPSKPDSGQLLREIWEKRNPSQKRQELVGCLKMTVHLQIIWSPSSSLRSRLVSFTFVSAPAISRAKNRRVHTHFHLSENFLSTSLTDSTRSLALHYFALHCRHCGCYSRVGWERRNGKQ